MVDLHLQSLIAPQTMINYCLRYGDFYVSVGPPELTCDPLWGFTVAKIYKKHIVSFRNAIHAISDRLTMHRWLLVENYDKLLDRYTWCLKEHIADTLQRLFAAKYNADVFRVSFDGFITSKLRRTIEPAPIKELFRTPELDTEISIGISPSIYSANVFRIAKLKLEANQIVRYEHYTPYTESHMIKELLSKIRLDPMPVETLQETINLALRRHSQWWHRTIAVFRYGVDV